MDEIINRVANSSLKVFDLEDYYVKGVRSTIDIADWLEEGFLLKEVDFRAKLKDIDWSKYENHLVNIICSTDAIIPAWSAILIATYLAPFARKVISGTINELDTVLYEEALSKVDYSEFENQAVIIKGCAKLPVPVSAYLMAVKNLQPIAKSIMYGEACSAVPLYKRAKII